MILRKMDTDFGIVAVSWPGARGEIAGALPGAATLEIRELDRDQILQVVREVGIDGPRNLQALLVNQSLGRAGLAVTLAYACTMGGVGSVATGDALLSDVIGWYSRSIGRHSRHVLGVLALAGNHGATIGQVAQALGLSVVQVSDVVRGLASGGTVDEGPGKDSQRLRVQPESLLYPLVRDLFFSGPGTLDVRSTIAILDSSSDALVPLVGAAHRGAIVDRNGQSSL
jgi:hypothetical protein